MICVFDNAPLHLCMFVVVLLMSCSCCCCSVAILKYLADKHQVADHWYPKDLQQRARVDCFMSWQHLNLRVGGLFVFRIQASRHAYTVLSVLFSSTSSQSWNVWPLALLQAWLTFTVFTGHFAGVFHQQKWKWRKCLAISAVSWWKYTQLECGPMPNVMAAQLNVGGTVCKSSVIPFLVWRRKLSLTPTARVPCSNAANTGERKTWMQSKFCMWQNSVRGKSPGKCIYTVPVQETVKHRAKFGWPALSDVVAVTKPRCETRWNLLGCPKLANRPQPLVGQSSPYYGDMWDTYCCLTSFFPSCQYVP